MEFVITDNYIWNVALPHQTWGFMGVFGAHWKARAKSPELDTTPILLERKTKYLIHGTQRSLILYSILCAFKYLTECKLKTTMKRQFFSEYQEFGSI